MKKIMIYISLVILALILIAVAVPVMMVVFDMRNPLRKSEELVRESILELTPIGTNMSEVILAIKNNERWDWSGHINHTSGYPTDASRNAFVGKQSIRVNVGKYLTLKNIIPFDTFVVVFWGFDEDSDLVDIRVWKDTVGF